VDAQVATANSIPWSSTAKFSRNGVPVAPLRVSYAYRNRVHSPGPEFYWTMHWEHLMWKMF
jgi:hypothetical protein